MKQLCDLAKEILHEEKFCRSGKVWSLQKGDVFF